MVFIGILTAIIVFCIIVLVHEFGHFKSARFFGVKVEEFGLGIPPKICEIKKDKLGTSYTLNFLPIGGFVRLKGENSENFLIYDDKKNKLNNTLIKKYIQEDIDIFDKNGEKIETEVKNQILKEILDYTAKDSFSSKSWFEKSIILLAGVFMNFLLAFLIYSILFFVGVKPIGINSAIPTQTHSKIIPTYEDAINLGVIKKDLGIILSPIKNSPAEKFGIKNSQIITKVNFCKTDLKDINSCIGGEKVIIKELNSPKELINILQKNPGKKVFFTDNFGKKIEIIIPKDGKIGAYVGENISINYDFENKYGFFDSIKYGFLETYYQANLTLSGMKLLLQKIISPKTQTERTTAISQVSGPIGIFDFISKSIGNGFVFILIISASISINLGVFNLLPIPALDGGRFIFVIINSLLSKIFKKPITNTFFETGIHITFFIFFIALSIIIAYNDIAKIIGR